MRVQRHACACAVLSIPAPDWHASVQMPADSLRHLSMRLLRLRSMPAAATAVTISAWLGVPLKQTLLARKSILCEPLVSRKTTGICNLSSEFEMSVSSYKTRSNSDESERYNERDAKATQRNAS
jgi:hypothetical protein